MHRDQRFQVSLLRLEEDLALTILATPTGKDRERLTDLQILIGAWKDGSYKDMLNAHNGS